MLLVRAVCHAVLLRRLLKTSLPGQKVQCIFCVETPVGHLNQFQLEKHIIKKTQQNFRFSLCLQVVCDRRDSFRELGGNPFKVQYCGEIEWSCLTLVVTKTLKTLFSSRFMLELMLPENFAYLIKDLEAYVTSQKFYCQNFLL